MRSKSAWFLVGLCVVAFVAIVRWQKEAKKEFVKTEEGERVKKDSLGETPVTHEDGQESLSFQQWSLQELEATRTDIITEESEEAETDITMKTVQGRVTDVDPCASVIVIDGVGFDAAPHHWARIQIGDNVEVNYTERSYGWGKGNVIQRIGVIGSSQQRTREEVTPEEAPMRVAEKAPRWEEFTEEEPSEGSEEMETEGLTEEEPSEGSEEMETDVPRTIQGRVTDHEYCSGVITIDGINFQPGSVDLTGIQIGDVVEITYTKKRYGNVIESIVFIERKD